MESGIFNRASTFTNIQAPTWLFIYRDCLKYLHKITKFHTLNTYAKLSPLRYCSYYSFIQELIVTTPSAIALGDADFRAILERFAV